MTSASPSASPRAGSPTGLRAWSTGSCRPGSPRRRSRVRPTGAGPPDRDRAGDPEGAVHLIAGASGRTKLLMIEGVAPRRSRSAGPGSASDHGADRWRGRAAVATGRRSADHALPIGPRAISSVGQSARFTSVRSLVEPSIAHHLARPSGPSRHRRWSAGRAVRGLDQAGPSRPHALFLSRNRDASQTRGAVIGSSRNRGPEAATIALATAAGPGDGASPMPLAPNGPSGAGTSTMSVSMIRDHGRPRERVVQERARQQLALVVVDVLLEQRPADALAAAAAHLALDQRRVERAADVLGDDEPEERHLAGLRVEPDVGDVRRRRRREAGVDRAGVAFDRRELAAEVCSAPRRTRRPAGRGPGEPAADAPSTISRSAGSISISRGVGEQLVGVRPPQRPAIAAPTSR